MFDGVVHPSIFLSVDWHPVGGRFYCPVCISLTTPPAPPGWNNRGEVVTHLRSIHKWEVAEYADALSGKELTYALVKWRSQARAAADEFGASLRLVRGVEDFLAECET